MSVLKKIYVCICKNLCLYFERYYQLSENIFEIDRYKEYEGKDDLNGYAKRFKDGLTQQGLFGENELNGRKDRWGNDIRQKFEKN